MIPRFRHYLFDIDGTLLDSAGDIVASVREVFVRRGQCHPADDELRRHIGRHLQATFSEAFPGHSRQQFEELIEDYRRAYHERNHQSTRVYEGVVEALAALEGKKATATTKSTLGTRKVLELFGLARYFDHVQGTDGFPAKPEPDVVLRAVQALGASPEDCLMVGDSPVDIEAGRRACVKTCAVRYGYGDPDLLAAAQPDYWVSDLRELASANLRR